MSVESVLASRAYAETAASGLDKTKGLAGPEETKAGANFGDLLEGVIQDAVSIGKESEVAAIASITNEADIVDMVTAITAAEVTLETIIAVRDKVIEAYESIMRMPI